MSTVLVLGDANCVLKDAEAALKLFTPEATAACNNIGLRWQGKVDHWCTLHPRGAEHWEDITVGLKRRVREGRNKPIVWAHQGAPGVDRITEDWMGSTGLFAIKVMLVDLGYDRAVLAGVPMTEEGAHFYSEERWAQATKYYRGWLRHFDLLKPRVRSMSGWTKEQFGLPTQEWLNQP